METDQAEQLDALSNQSTKVLNKICDTEDMPLPLLNRAIGVHNTLIVRTLKWKKIMAKKRDSTLIIGNNKK